MDGEDEGRVHPTKLIDHWTEVLGSYFRHHGTLSQSVIFVKRYPLVWLMVSNLDEGHRPALQSVAVHPFCQTAKSPNLRLHCFLILYLDLSHLFVTGEQVFGILPLLFRLLVA